MKGENSRDERKKGLGRGGKTKPRNWERRRPEVAWKVLEGEISRQEVKKKRHRPKNLETGREGKKKRRGSCVKEIRKRSPQGGTPVHWTGEKKRTAYSSEVTQKFGLENSERKSQN